MPKRPLSVSFYLGFRKGHFARIIVGLILIIVDISLLLTLILEGDLLAILLITTITLVISMGITSVSYADIPEKDYEVLFRYGVTSSSWFRSSLIWFSLLLILFCSIYQLWRVLVI